MVHIVISVRTGVSFSVYQNKIKQIKLARFQLHSYAHIAHCHILVSFMGYNQQLVVGSVSLNLRDNYFMCLGIPISYLGRGAVKTAFMVQHFVRVILMVNPVLISHSTTYVVSSFSKPTPIR
jgi:hypothetical protein